MWHDTRKQERPDSRKRRHPQAVGEVISQLFARRGYARQSAANAWTEAWNQAAGRAFAEGSRAGGLRRGVLEVVVKNSILMQDIAFEKKRILTDLKKLVPEAGIRDLRFRIGALE